MFILLRLTKVLHRVVLPSFLVCLLSAATCNTPTADPQKSNNRVELAKDFLSRQELTSAKREASKALKYNKRNAEAHVILGLVEFLSALNNHRLLEIDDCLIGLDAEGLREEMESSLQAADKSFGRALALDPDYSEARHNQAKVAELLEDYPRSIELNEAALEVPHRLINVALTRANLGWARFKSGDMVGAAKELRQSLQFNASMCVAKYRLGRVYFEREEWNKAVEQFQVVVDTEVCGTQKAHLYLIRTMKELALTSDTTEQPAILDFDLQEAVGKCTAMAPKSCVAAQCQAGL